MHLPIAAEAEAASKTVAALPEATRRDRVDAPQHLPARAEASGPAQRGAPLIPSIPEVTKAAARWIRPLVPPAVARTIDAATSPLRAARQVFEEVEEITFSLKRTHKVSVDVSADTAENLQPPQHRVEAVGADATADPRWVESSFDRSDGLGSGPGGRAGQLDRSGRDGQQFGLDAAERGRELTERSGPRELGESDGPRGLPPAR